MKIKLVSGVTVLVDDCDAHLLTNLFIHRTKRSPSGYIRKVVGKKKFFLHRLILGVTDPRVFVDHVNGNPYDNRRENLRIATNAQNQANSLSKVGSSSRYKGVWWDSRKHRWRMDIERTVNGRRERVRRSFGRDGEDDAARAYDEIAREWFGDFAKLNFPDVESPTSPT